MIWCSYRTYVFAYVLRKSLTWVQLPLTTSSTLAVLKTKRKKLAKIIQS